MNSSSRNRSWNWESARDHSRWYWDRRFDMFHCLWSWLKSGIEWFFEAELIVRRLAAWLACGMALMKGLAPSLTVQWRCASERKNISSCNNFWKMHRCRVVQSFAFAVLCFRFLCTVVGWFVSSMVFVLASLKGTLVVTSVRYRNFVGKCIRELDRRVYIEMVWQKLAWSNEQNFMFVKLLTISGGRCQKTETLQACIFEKVLYELLGRLMKFTQKWESRQTSIRGSNSQL